METKICKKCGQEKSISEFNKDIRTHDGLNNWCKECANIIKRNHRERNKLKNKDKIFDENETKICTKCGIEKPITEFVKDSKTKDGLYQWCKECKYPVNIDWQKNNPDKRQDISKRSYDKNIESITKKRHESYNNKHLHHLLFSCINRAKEKGVPYDLIEDLEQELQFSYSLGICECCGKELMITKGSGNKKDNFSIDRIIPEKVILLAMWLLFAVIVIDKKVT